MKKLSLVLMLLPLFARSQTSGFPKSANGNQIDTLTNAGTKYLTVSSLDGSFNYCSVSATLTNISGTSAATVTLEHSADRVNFYSVPTDSVLSLSGTGTKGLVWSGYRDKALRLKFVGSGTQSTKIQAYFSLR